MRILVLTFYYPPDLSAGSFRAKALVAALRERAPRDTQVDVLTTLPNRYRTFTQEAAELEVADRLEIRRIGLPPHRSDIGGQSRAFLRFARQSLRHTKHRRYDLVVATSSRLMTAALGAWIARRQRARLYLDIRDIFAETIGELLPAPIGWAAGRLFSMIERWTMRSADRINLVSPGFEGYFRARYRDPPLAWFTNGIDEEFIALAQTEVAQTASPGKANVLYAGNVGDGQALHHILPGLAKALRGRADFIVIGDGGRRAELAAAVAGLDNVQLHAPVPRAQLIDAYKEAHVLFLHLGKRAAFERVLPSKLFEYGALGKPVLAGVAGYAARFVTEEIDNAAVFPPCDVAAAVAAFSSLELVARPRRAFVAKYARAKIAREMADDVVALLNERR
jgi:glycosyltransferase involved in cell wall biosynthesis